MKRCIALLALFILVFSSLGTNTEAATFNDLGKNHRFYSEMVFLEDKKIITGYPNETIRPDEKVTRAAAAIMVGRALGLDGKQRATKFPDVGKNQKASGYVASAAEEGIISGFEDGTFRPNDTVTRGQMAIFLSRAFSLKKEASVPFKDVSPSMKSYSHIKKIIAANLTSGYEDNTYRPNVGITRAQFSAFLARALDDRFKVEIPVALVSYLMDRNKAYHYYMKDQENIVYKPAWRSYFGWSLWDVYVNNKLDYSVVEKEDKKGYVFGYPESESWMLIKYPVKVGQAWEVADQGQIYPHKVTATNLTMTTRAGTFKNVIQITSVNNRASYYAPNVGLIKVTENGQTIQELAKLESNKPIKKTTLEEAYKIIDASKEYPGKPEELFYKELPSGAIELSWLVDFGSGAYTTMNRWIIHDGRIVERLWNNDEFNRNYWSSPYHRTTF